MHILQKKNKNNTSITPTICPPVISKPVVKASPTGKVISHAKSKHKGRRGNAPKPIKKQAKHHAML